MNISIDTAGVRRLARKAFAKILLSPSRALGKLRAGEVFDGDTLKRACDGAHFGFWVPRAVLKLQKRLD